MLPFSIFHVACESAFHSSYIMNGALGQEWPRKTIPGREKLCPGKTLSGRNSDGKNSVPSTVQLGWGEYIDRREAPEIFEGNLAYNWRLCVHKIQQSLSWPEKFLSQPLKRLEKYCPEIWDRIFPTGVFPGRSFSLRYLCA
jgi:hypothetical protein